MRHFFYLFLIQLLCFACAFSAFCQNHAVIETLKSGTIDWTNRKVTAVSATPAPQKSISEEQKNELFKKVKIDASKKLFATMGNIRINAAKTLNDIIGPRPDLLRQIQLMINNATVTRKNALKAGSAEIRLQTDLDKGLAQLVLPEEIVQIEKIKTSAAPSQQTQGKEYTGVIIDARGLTVIPVMSPKILDENNKEAYGPAFISREHAVQHGTVQYVKGMVENKRAGARPIVVTGLKSSPENNADIIISTADSSKLHSNSKNLDLLHQGKVVIVLDAPKKKQ